MYLITVSNDLVSQALIARTCNCMYALIQQRQQDAEFRETAHETRRRCELDFVT